MTDQNPTNSFCDLIIKEYKPADSILEQAREVYNLCGPDDNLNDVTTAGIGLDKNLEVVRVMIVEVGLDIRSVIAFLLYKLIESQKISPEFAKERYGQEVTDIAGQIIRINSIRTRKAAYQSEHFRKLLFSVAGDVRSILIKLAERMVEMRFLSEAPDINGKNIAEETAYLYAPVAHRLGLYHVKTELEENTMRALYPDEYHSIGEKLKESKEIREDYITEFIEPLQTMLQENAIICKIKGRTKSISSIWNKMKNQQVELDEIFDVFAIRVIIDSPPEKEKELCWKVYSLITNLFPPDTKRLRDWISRPKASGYESLHTTVLGPQNKWVEVQIRTQRMDEVAEKGNAAHWKYKSKGAGENAGLWLANIRNMLETPGQETFVSAKGNNPFSDAIFVFTPEGDLKELRQGSSVLDFAFDVHTNVGFHCSGAKVNGKIVPIKQLLQNGDYVEVLTSKNQKPKSDWLEFVISPRAKNKIKRALKEEEFKKNEEGKEILKKKLNQLKIEFSEETLKKLLKHFHLKDYLELFHSIAILKADINEVSKVFAPPETKTRFDQNIIKTVDVPVRYAKNKDALELDDAAGVSDFRMAKCCNPIFGDPIFGFITIGKGIKIHRKNCPNASNMSSRFEYRIINARWVKTDGEHGYPTIIRITGQDRTGIMNDITKTVSGDMKVDMRSLHAGSDSGIFYCTAELKVSDVDHLETLISKVKKIKGVISVTRAEI